MLGTHESDTKIMKDLVKELNEFNSYVREGIAPIGHSYTNGNYFYAFTPSSNIDKIEYYRNMKLLNTIYDFLDENHLNVKSQGYTYLKDAICIVSDKKSLEISLVKEIYPYISQKYKLKEKGVDKIEHSIRNAIDAAYHLAKTEYPYDGCLMNQFTKKPTNKIFILKAAQEVSRRLINDFRS